MGHVHEGHRARLRERLAREGLDHFQPHEVIELLLFYCIPVRNVNQLAHDLVNRFQSVGGVLRATREDLMSVQGVGAATADWLTSLQPILDEYINCKLTDRPQLTRSSAVTDYMARVMPDLPDRQVWALALTQSGHVLGCAQIGAGQAARNPDMRVLADFLLRYRTQRVVLVQRRLASEMEPDAHDLAMVQRLDALLKPLRIVLMDVLLFCGHRQVSFHKLRIVQPSTQFGILSEDQPQALDGEGWDD